MKRRYPFYRIASLVTAADLQQPLGKHVEIDANARDTYLERIEDDETGESFDAVSLVMEGSQVVAWWSCDTFAAASGTDDTSSSIRNYALPIPLSSVTSGNTSFHDLAHALTERESPFLFVVDGVEITGVVSQLDLFSRTGQLCLLSLMFLLESVAEGLCLHRAEECWLTLPPGRRDSSERFAIKRFGRRAHTGHQRFAPLVRTTSLSDKCTMLLSTGMLNTPAPSEIQAVFDIAERVRNLCAHGGDEQELYFSLADDLDSFLRRIHNLVEAMQLRLKELDG